jgi:hypothetical protein
MQGNFGALEHLEQLRLIGVKPREQTVEGDEAGFAGEDAIELGFQNSLALRGRRATAGLELAVELPDGGTHGGLVGAVLVREGVELVNQAPGMNPAQAMLTDGGPLRPPSPALPDARTVSRLRWGNGPGPSG